MANKEIIINKDRIVIKKLIGSTLETTFNTDNLYLKTDPSGVLKVGGYERCPVIVGEQTIVDDTRYGGFPLYNAGGRSYDANLDARFILPEGSLSSCISYAEQGISASNNFVWITYESPLQNIKGTNGSDIGTFKWYIIGTNQPPSNEFPITSGFANYYEAVIKNVNFTNQPADNTYIFPYYPKGSSWYKTSVNQGSGWSSFDTNQFVIFNIQVFAIVSSKTLSLAVTL